MFLVIIEIIVEKNSVGKISPASNCRVKIIDDEICVTGDIVFKEYLNDPTATEEAFVDNYFKTGDLGYVDKEGFIYITGRKKKSYYFVGWK